MMSYEPPAMSDEPGKLTAQSSKLSASRPRLLMLTHRVPYPPDRGDRIRSYHLARLLSQHFDLSIACTTTTPVTAQQEAALQSIAKRLAVCPLGAALSKLKSVAALVTGRAITPTYHFRGGLADAILGWHRREPFDAVLTFCTGMVGYAALIDSPRHVLDLVDVDSLKWRSYGDSAGPAMRWVYRAEARRLRRIEADDPRRFDAITVISDAEADAYREHVGDHPGLRVISNGVDIDYFHAQPDSPARTIGFVGVLDYKPNVEGISWFVREVWPQVKDATLLIVGRDPSAAVLKLGNTPGVHVVGPVDDVRDYLRQAAAVIAPLRIARGVQNKVLEAMASQRAVVCSPAAAQGIDARDGEHLIVADEPTQWAAAIQRLLADADHRNRLAAGARRQVETRYAWDRCLQPMIELLGAR